jgi:hypothetical protein
VIVGTAFALVYLGALAFVAAILELVVELSKLFAVWIKRKVFTVATWITRMSSWISSLGGRLVSRSRRLARRRRSREPWPSRLAITRPSLSPTPAEAHVSTAETGCNVRGRFRAVVVALDCGDALCHRTGRHVDGVGVFRDAVAPPAAASCSGRHPRAGAPAT